jgi:hypothetical protein
MLPIARAQIQRLLLVAGLVSWLNPLVSVGHRIVCHQLSVDPVGLRARHGLCLGATFGFVRHCLK